MERSNIAVDILKFKTILKFDVISEQQNGKLIGGFSGAFSVESLYTTINTVSNNCNGQNCASGCGTGQNIHCNTGIQCIP